jgi:enamine deaminase RidA (YjgF/YER057c/UK114 family)
MRAMSHLSKLQELGYTLDPLELNAGRLMHAVRTGNLVYTSGQVSRWGETLIKGKVGDDLSVEQGYEAAKLCALNCLRAAHQLVGLDNIVRVVKVLGMVNVGANFNNTPGVIHGASDLLIAVFGEAGRHARSAVGMTIPDNFAVEVEAIFEVKG